MQVSQRRAAYDGSEKVQNCRMLERRRSLSFRWGRSLTQKLIDSWPDGLKCKMSVHLGLLPRRPTLGEHLANTNSGVTMTILYSRS